ncbi:aspartic proteinase CDR1-like [Bidens hawaiensis]|uniref:aspartic proteinase CDR1-like n=1 Tax=Bidens hawaiensis TaxID=980011 RepID=UPI00404AD672
MIVDFESALTALPEDMYSSFAYIITRVIDGKRVTGPLGYDQICYKDLNVDSVPIVTLRFDGGDIEVSPVNLFMEVQKGVSCMIIISTEDMGMLGNLVQRNLMVGFDLVKRKIYFKPTDCSMK